MAVNDSNTHTVLLRRTVQASIDAAYDALTEPELLSRWFTSGAEADLRVGGRYSNADNDKGTYLILDRPTHIRFTWDNEEHCPYTVVDVSFEEVGPDRVEVTLAHSGIADLAGRDDMEHGWSWA